MNAVGVLLLACVGAAAASQCSLSGGSCVSVFGGFCASGERYVRTGCMADEVCCLPRQEVKQLEVQPAGEQADEPTLLTLPTTNCGVSKYSDAGSKKGYYIVGGVEARQGEFPWQISLQEYGRHICGGMVMDNQYIVTAAHCVIGSRARNLKVVVGEWNRNSNDPNERTVGVSRIIMNNGYDDRTLENDIALLKLSSTISFNDDVQPICAPTAGDDYTGTFCTVSGWGTTSSGGGSLPSKLRYVNVPVISNFECQQGYGSDITPTMVCAGYSNGGKDSCQGDSGGPLVCKSGNKWQLVGIVSWGYGCADAGYPGVYTRVTEFTSWISANRT